MSKSSGREPGARQPKIFFLGASGVGKTTLARHVSSKLGLPMLTGATKVALETVGCSFDEMLTDVAVADRYQTAVWQAQRDMEEPYWRSSSTGFVSDRSLDLLAYTAKQSRVVVELLRQPGFVQYVRRMRQAICFFIRPCDLVRAPRDGRRDRFLEPEWVWGVDAVIEFLLESNEVPYVAINGPSLRDRVRTVDTVVGMACPVSPSQ